MYQRSPLWDFSGRERQFQSTLRSKWSDRLAKLREFTFPSWSAKHAAYIHKAESGAGPAEMGAGSSASPSAAASPPPSSSVSSSEDRSKPKQEHKEQQPLQAEDDITSIVAADDPVRVVVSTSPASSVQDLVSVLSADSPAATSVDGVSNDGADLHIVVEPLSTPIDDPAPPLTANIAMAASIPPTAPLPELVKKTLGVPSLSATTSPSASSIPSSSSSGQAPSFASLRKLPTISHLHDQTTLSGDSYLGSTITSTVSAANVAANAPATAAADDNALPPALSQTPPSSTSSSSSSSAAVASHLPSFASLADDDLRIAPPSGPRPLYHSKPLPSSSTSTSTSPSVQSVQTPVASPPLPPKTTADTHTASSSSSPSSSTTSATLKTPSFPPAVTMTPFSSFSSPSCSSSSSPSSSPSSSSATSPLSTPGGNSPTPVPIESITVKALQLPPPSFMAGAFAGAFTSAILHPLDLLKLRMQADAGNAVRPTMRTAFESATKTTGLRGLWTGVGVNVIANTLSWGMFFGMSGYITAALEQAVSDIVESGETLDPTAAMFAAAISKSVAGATIGVATNPLWVVKTRMCLMHEAPEAVEKRLAQAFLERERAAAAAVVVGNATTPSTSSSSSSSSSSSLRGGQVSWRPVTHGTGYKYTSTTNALLSIYKEEGLKGLFSGWKPGVVASMHGVVQITIYEQLSKALGTHSRLFPEITVVRSKTVVRKDGADPTRPDVVEQFTNNVATVSAAAVGSRVATTLVLYPFQLVRTQLQDSRKGVPLVTGITDAFRRTLASGRPMSIFQGLLVHLIRGSLHSMVFFNALETARVAILAKNIIDTEAGKTPSKGKGGSTSSSSTSSSNSGGSIGGTGGENEGPGSRKNRPAAIEEHEKRLREVFETQRKLHQKWMKEQERQSKTNQQQADEAFKKHGASGSKDNNSSSNDSNSNSNDR